MCEFFVDYLQGDDPETEIFTLYNVTNLAYVATPFIAFAMYTLSFNVRLLEELKALASTDLLTGLSNRGAFLHWVELALKADGGMLILTDLDHFKSVNDTYGHAAGDICLEAAARHLEQAAGDDAIVGRLGGEEFGMFLPGATEEQALAVANALVPGFSAIFDGRHIDVTLSAGIESLDVGAPLAVALSHADEAMYRAKQRGRARAVRFDLNLRDEGQALDALLKAG